MRGGSVVRECYQVSYISYCSCQVSVNQMTLPANASLRQFRYFCAAAELKQFSLAARQLRVSQSVVTTAVRQLEAMMGVTLFDRLPHGVELTAEGHRFHQRIRHILDSLEDALEEPHHAAHDLAGSVRIGASYVVLGYFLCGLLARFRRTYPHVGIDLVDMDRQGIEAGVRSGDLDLGLCIVSNCDPGLALARKVLLRSRRQLWVCDQHALMGQDDVRLADVAGYPYIMLTVDEGEASASRYWRATGLEPKVGFRTSSMEALRGLVAYGFGVTILSDMVYRSWSLDGRKIQARPISEKIPPMEVGMLSRPDADWTPAARAFRQFAEIACGV